MTTGFSPQQPADVNGFALTEHAEGRLLRIRSSAGPGALGPGWAGVVVALPVYLVLQMLFFTLSIIDLGVNGEGQSTIASIVSAILALIAFFVGGLMAGSTAASRDSDEGLLHGVLTWAVGIVAILGFGLLGSGALLGNLSNATA